MITRVRRALIAILLVPFLAATVSVALQKPLVTPVQAAVFEDWPTFLHDTARSGTSHEAILNTGNAGLLKLRFAYKTGGLIAASAAIVAGTVYVGSWDGYEYAIDARAGTLKWRTFLGQTVDPACHPPTIGITSGAAVLNGVVYVGGGDTFWYALDSATGNVLWKVFTGDNTQAGAHYNWSSPLLYNGYAYIGIASNCDAPLVQGQVMQVNLATHQVVNVTNFVPAGQVGGGVWTSPAADPATNSIWVSTGTLNLQTQTMSEAIVQMDVNTLAVKSVWQLPRDQAGLDTDWGTTPTLMTDKNGRLLVAVANKNGVLYAFDRTNLAAGPVWQKSVAFGGDCPPCGDGTISSGAFANGTLYYASGNTVIGGVGYRGAVRAFDPATGNVLWEHGTDQAVIPAIAYDNGLVVDAAGPVLEVLDAATGHSLYTYNTNTGASIYAAPAISGGIIYVGGADGNLNAINLGAAVAIPPDPNCPAGWTCQDIRTPAAGSETLVNGTLTVTAAGAAIHGNGDQFRFISQPVGGDAQVQTELLNQSVQGPTPQAGLMMRQSNDATSPFYAILEYPNDQPDGLPLPTIRVWYRTAFGAVAIQANKYYPTVYPEYMRILRVGNTFMAGLSQDGVKWQILPGSQTPILMPYTLLDGLATDSSITGTTGTASYNFTNTAIGPVTPLPPVPTPTACPGLWACQDVGAPSPVGDQALNGTTWTLQGTGPDITNTVDQFHFVYQPMPADGTISAHFVTQANTSANAKAGLMLRQTVDWGSAYYGIFVTPGKGIAVQWRATSNLRTQLVTIPGAAPQYLQLSRYTDPATSVTWYTAFTSPDGITWNAVLGTTVAIPLTGTLLAGMAADANAPRVTSAVTVDTVSVTNNSVRPPTICPVGWSCTDIGTATPPGGQVVQNGTWSMSAGGSDIWIDYDLFRFAYQTLQADGSITARVVSEGGGVWQKAGVMLRFSTDPNSPYYAAFATPTNGIAIQFRTAIGALTNQVLVPGPLPAYLRVARATDPRTSVQYYTTYTSPDGVAWTPVAGSTVILQMPGFLLAGLAADSYTGGTATATFDNVAISTDPALPSVICPAPWICTDINGAQPSGAQAVSNGNWALQGGGGDIWDAADNFRLAYQNVPGDGGVSAHVTSQTNTDPWAKGGVMLRATVDPGSPYFAVFVTPGHGLAVQDRTAQGGTSNQLVVAGVIPTYLMVARAGNTFTAYQSNDGVAWTAIPGSSVSLPALAGAVLGGLAVSSHNTLSLSTVAYDTIVFATTAPAPAISGVTANPAWAQATITWNTDTLADSQVEYGPTAAYGFTTTLDPTLVNAHSQVITGLTQTTTYHYRVRSHDASGQLSVSPDATFTTVVSPCPPGWTCGDIGNPTPAGSESVANGVWTVSGGGGDIWGTFDTFQYESQALAGNGTVSAHLRAQGNSDPWAKAGVMMRGSADPGAPYYAVFATPAHGLAIQYRAAQGGTSTQILANGTVPLYVMVARAGTTFTAYTSADGVTWTAVTGTSISLPNLTGSLLAGMAVTSHNVVAVSTVTFDTVAFGATAPAPVITNVTALSVSASAATISWTTDTLSDSKVDYSTDTSYANSTLLAPALTTAHSVTVTGLTPSTLYNFRVDSSDNAGQLSTAVGTPFTTTASTCPAGWTCQDVGNPTPIGSETVTGANWSITGGGADIWAAADAFHFDSQPLAGNGTVSAHITSQTNTNVWAKAGLMLRLTADPGSPYYAILVTASNGIAIQYRLAQGGATGQLLAPGAPPTYLRITRGGSTFTAYTSQDGTTWAVVNGSSLSVPNLAGPLMAGFAVTSHNVAAVSTAAFDTVTFANTVPAPTLSQIQALGTQDTTTTIAWTTDTLADSQVNWGPTAAYGNTTVLDPTLTTAHAQGLTGLTPNTTYHYQVMSRDDAGQLTTSPDEMFTTAPLPPAISAVTATGIDANDATITWTTDTVSDSQVEYGLTATYGSRSALNGALVTAHSVALNGLAPHTTYHYHVLSRDQYGQLSTSPDFQLTTPNPPPPTITGIQVTSITQTGATVTWTTSTPTSSQVNYGLTATYGSSTVLDPTLVLNHSQAITGLTLNTTYHFDVTGSDQIAQPVTSTDQTFTTAPAAPAISALTATVNGPTSATITWTTDTASSSVVNYGVTTTYGSVSQSATPVTAHSIALTGLAPNTTYHFQVQSTDAFNQTTSSADATFVTPTPPPPAISAVVATPTPTTATITWTTDTASTSQVNYGTATPYTNGTAQDPTLVTSHSVSITGLTPNTTYHFQVVSVDAYAQQSASADATFTTPKPPPPVVSNVTVTGITNTGATVSWTTDVASSSQVAYGPTATYGTTTTLDPTAVTAHSQALTGLTPGQTYHFQVMSTDGYAQTTLSADATFTTIPAPPVITNTEPTAVTNSGATITWTTSTPSNSQVSYGLTMTYGTTTPANPAMVTAHSIALTGLSPSTTYHVQVASTDAYAQQTLSADFTFTTLPLPPAITNVQAGALTASTATITWTTSTTATSQVNYGVTPGYGLTTAQDPTLVTLHSQTISNLQAVTTYHFQVVSVDQYGQASASADFIFTTTSCPNSWTCADIGNTAVAGGQTVNAGVWTITGSGADIGGTADAFHFDYQALAGDGTITAHVTQQTNTNAFAKAGVMIRQSADPGAMNYAALITPANGIRIQYRNVQGGGMTTQTTMAGTVPVYLAINRTGTSFQAYTSTDGMIWTLVPNSTKVVPITGAALIGLAVTSHNATVLGQATFDQLNVGAGTAPLTAPCPVAWNCADVGGALPVGNQALTAGAWTIVGGGADIGGAADQFHFVWQPLAGDGSVSAHLTAAPTNTNANAKAGVMLRQTADPGSPYYAAFITPTQVVVQMRIAQGGATTVVTTLAGTAPIYLKVTRAGTTFTAYTSQDGVTWTLIPNSTKVIAIAGGMLQGLAVTAHSVNAQCTGKFDTVVTT